ncbi:perilipin-2-like [Thalassophryne amazonica]|uniref:perilipin-2-like n=1 Tax=Thalassophryne amazonica TaxID=390379 RepID=UPI00147158E5|nr:perilipin-2-like [Thalassophryne amazonica]
MPRNNNQKMQSAAVRLTELPLVRSLCAKLTVLYVGTKCSHPNLTSVCEVMENSVVALGTVACDTVLPVIIKLEPQISLANDIACKSLDWLETAFPVLHEPTEQIGIRAKKKILEIQDTVSGAANGTMVCVLHTVMWVMGRAQRVTGFNGYTADGVAKQSLMVQAISVGLDSALNTSEALMNQMLPPTKDDKEEELQLVEGFEANVPKQSYTVRLFTLTVKLYRRTYHRVAEKMTSVQVMKSLQSPSGLVQDLQSGWRSWSLQGLPRYLQDQAVAVSIFVSQMYNLTCPSARHQSNIRIPLKAVGASWGQRNVGQVHRQVSPSCRLRKSARKSVVAGQ